MTHPAPARAALRAALLTAASTGGSLALAFAATWLANRTLPAAMERLGQPAFYGILLLASLLGGLAWARGVARVTGRTGPGLRGALGFGLSTPAAVWALTAAEGVLQRLAQDGRVLPVHVVFAVLFTGATFLVVYPSVLLLGLALDERRRAARLAGRSAAAATLAFLGTTLLFDLLGWRVGAPGAEERFTMMTVMTVGCLLAALTGGAVLGRRLAPRT